MFNESVIVTENVSFKINRTFLIFTLMLMSTAGLVGTDVYLPTLPVIGKILHQDPAHMKFTLGIYLVGLAIGQLILGPLTDRFGRKKLLILGMFLYLLGSVFCANAVTYIEMLFFRLIQALGACSGLIIGRAIVGDMFDTKEAGKIFSTIFPFVGMSPAISPMIGGYIGFYLGWQATFWFVGFYAAVVGSLALSLPETLIASRRQELNLQNIFKIYISLLFNKKFIAYLLLPCIAYIVYFAYIAQSPFIFDMYGFNEISIGMFYVTLSLAYVLGNLLGRYLLKLFSLDRVIYIGLLLFNLGGIFLLMTGVFNLGLTLMIISASVLTLGNGFIIPLGTAGVINSVSKNKGYSSGLLGFLQLGAAAISTAIVGAICQNSILKMAIYIIFFTGACLISFYLLQRNFSRFEKS